MNDSGIADGSLDEVWTCYLRVLVLRLPASC